MLTWPTRKIGIWLLLASSISWPAHSRTWLTLPGAELTPFMNTVWIESTTAIIGAGRRKVFHDAFQVVFGEHHQAVARDVEALGTQLELLHGFLP